jgi:transposase
MRRYELTDEAWLRLEPLMPAPKPGGRWNDHRTTLHGMFWVLHSGAPWRDMPDRYGKWQSVYHRYRRWTRDGLIDRILHTLQLELDAQGRIDGSQFNIDGSNIRAGRSAAGARKKGGRTTSRTITGLADHEGVGAASFTW